jgi:hypothetical protein
MGWRSFVLLVIARKFVRRRRLCRRYTAAGQMHDQPLETAHPDRVDLNHNAADSVEVRQVGEDRGIWP